MSARKVIPNWPRGKSTTTAWSNTKWEYATELQFWPYYLTPEMNLDYIFDRIYHEQQKAMVDNWHANWRTHHYKYHTVIGNIR